MTTNERDENKAAGDLAHSIADYAERCVGPDGTVVRVPADDAPLVRIALVSRIAEAAMKILDERASL